MIIAEIGLNHLGNREYLFEYIDTLLGSPIDAITLQFREEEFYNNDQYSNLMISKSLYIEVIKKIKNGGKKFGIALSNLKHVSFFNDKVDFYKILSKDLGNHEFIDNFINLVDKPIYLSTGLSSYEKILSFIDKIKVSKKKNINLIHTRLSNRIEDTNLKAIQKMKSFFGLPIAFGNHCDNPIVTYAAVAFEPSAIFLYVKGDRSISHPDENHAISLNDIFNFSTNIKNITKSIGTGEKQEAKNIIRGQK